MLGGVIQGDSRSSDTRPVPAGEMQLEILMYPDARLRQPGEDVKEITAETLESIREMFDLMYEARGVGLAAVQAGWPVRVFVFNLAAEPPTGENGGEEIVCINPRIVHESGRVAEEEGCLSFPGIRGKVVRSAEVTLDYYDEHGQPMTIEESGLPAIAIQHEMDHLDGRLFISRMTTLSRMKVDPRLKDLEAEFAAEAG